MSTLHLVEIDDEENIVDERELTDDILESLDEETGETELSLSDDNNSLYVVELDDAGNIVGAEMLGDDDAEDDTEDDTELSLSDRVEELELGLASFLGQKAMAAGRLAGRGAMKVKSAMGNSFSRGGTGNRLLRKGRIAAVKTGRAVRTMAGQAATTVGGAIKSGGSKAANGFKSLSTRNKAGVVGGTAAIGGGMAYGVNRRRNTSLSLSAAQLQSAEHNPMLADAQKRLPAAK